MLPAIVTTHQHWDHWQVLGEVVAATGARTIAGEHDHDGISVPTDALLADGDTLTVGDSTLEIIELVGHTPGSVALLYRGDPERPHLFTGDCLFPGGVGNTKNEGRTSSRSTATSRPSFSTGCRTRPGSTPATAATRRLVQSVRRWRSGASAAGDEPRSPTEPTQPQSPGCANRTDAGMTALPGLLAEMVRAWTEWGYDLGDRLAPGVSRGHVESVLARFGFTVPRRARRVVCLGQRRGA